MLTLGLSLGLFSFSALAKGPGPLGVGVVLGQPSGITARYRLKSNRSVDANIAWSMNSPGYVAISSDYLFEVKNFAHIDQATFDLHYGLGAAIVTASGFTGIGARAPVGVSYFFKDPAVQIYLEISGLLTLVPDSDFWIHGALGARYYF